MNEETFNISIRKFLKQFGVTAQREIEHAVQRGLAEGTIGESARIPVRATLTLEGLVAEYHVDGEISLS